MTVQELIDRLKKFDPDLQVLIGIDHSCGFADHDYIDAYYIEHVYRRRLEEPNEPPLCGNFIASPDIDESKNQELVIIYNYP